VQVPEAKGLFSKPTVAKPCILIVAGVVKTFYPPNQRIVQMVVSKEFFHGKAIEEQIIVRIAFIDTAVPAGYLFFFFRFVSGIVTAVSAVPFLLRTRTKHQNQEAKNAESLFHVVENAKLMPNKKSNHLCR
jgi:hypothetical protein